MVHAEMWILREALLALRLRDQSQVSCPRSSFLPLFTTLYYTDASLSDNPYAPLLISAQPQSFPHAEIQVLGARLFKRFIGKPVLACSLLFRLNAIQNMLLFQYAGIMLMGTKTAVQHLQRWCQVCCVIAPWTAHARSSLLRRLSPLPHPPAAYEDISFSDALKACECIQACALRDDTCTDRARRHLSDLETRKP